MVADLACRCVLGIVFCAPCTSENQSMLIASQRHAAQLVSPRCNHHRSSQLPTDSQRTSVWISSRSGCPTLAASQLRHLRNITKHAPHAPIGGKVSSWQSIREAAVVLHGSYMRSSNWACVACSVIQSVLDLEERAWDRWCWGCSYLSRTSSLESLAQALDYRLQLTCCLLHLPGLAFCIDCCLSHGQQPFLLCMTLRDHK